MPVKIPEINNRNGSMVLKALQKLLPNLQKMGFSPYVFEIVSFLLLERFCRNQDKILNKSGCPL